METLRETIGQGLQAKMTADQAGALFRQAVAGTDENFDAMLQKLELDVWDRTGHAKKWS